MKRGAHYHCPVNDWDCPTIKTMRLLRETRSSVCVKSPATSMKSVMIFSLCSGKTVSLMITPIIAKKITKNKD